MRGDRSDDDDAPPPGQGLPAVRADVALILAVVNLADGGQAGPMPGVTSLMTSTPRSPILRSRSDARFHNAGPVRPAPRHHVRRVIPGSAPIRYGIVDGMNVRDSRVHNYPPLERRAKPGPAGDPAKSSDRRGMTRSTALGPHSLLVSGRQGRTQADQRQMRDSSQSADFPRSYWQRRCIVPPSRDRRPSGLMPSP
jgi:hypothetical protein